MEDMTLKEITMPNYNNCEKCICYKAKCLFRNIQGCCIRYDNIPKCGDTDCLIEHCFSMTIPLVKRRPW